MSKTTTVFQGKRFTKSFKPRDKVTKGHDIGINREPYLLEKDEFRVIISSEHFAYSDFTINVCAGSVWALLIAGGKSISGAYTNNSVVIETWEWLIPLVIFAASLIFLWVCKFIPSEKKDLITQIESQFQKEGTLQIKKKK